ncbi:MAG: hypothetical protein KDB26_15975 [Microthrixaceae bacterium]|nr:hypothetical protein [Microthrixaceae bacterium]
MRIRGRVSVFVVAVASIGLLGACGGSGESTAKIGAKKTSSTTAFDPGPDDPGEMEEPPEDLGISSGPTEEFVNIIEPVNGAFTVDVPVGWDNLAYSVVDGQAYEEVVNSVSPDGETVLFLGDPKLATYWIPSMADDIVRQMAQFVETMVLADYSPAPDYVQQWITDKFGTFDGFTITNTDRLPEVEQSARDGAASVGGQLAAADAARTFFTFTDSDGKQTNAAVSALTMNFGISWRVFITGIATTGNIADYEGMLEHMGNSKKTTEEFKASQNQRHQQTMAMIQQRTEEMTRRHEANMAWIQDSANAHQQRMQSIWQANDASVAGFYDRMASGDVEHRQFLNAINGESTVQNSSGQKMQVDNSYQRYYVNKNDNSYVGGDINFGDSQLRALGLNPSDYEEANIVKG